MIPAEQALDRLREGNGRFVAAAPTRDAATDEHRRSLAEAQQRPFAIVLGCSDSRVPAEIVFDQGLGDLFVVRVAGNVVAESQIDSVEFAATQFATTLVVVLGHSRCGAVAATVEHLRSGSGDPPEACRSILDRITPSIKPLLDSDAASDADALMQQAVRANVLASAEQLRHGSKALEQLVSDGRLQVVSAEYSLESGAVDFFDGCP